MFGKLARAVFGSANDRQIKPLKKKVAAINAQEEALQQLSDAELQAKTQEFRDRVAGGESEDKLLAEAFAVVREASVRVLGMRHFDVQMIGGMVQHEGRISEMATGEGKTLVATLAAYLNALSGKGVHVVTVNDYLARRDAEWMGKLYSFLGLTTGVIVPGIADDERRAAYAADITYGTNNEFGFDLLRDNMKFSRADMVQRPFNFAIVDEVDSILIDEARTPLIISGPAEDSSELYRAIDTLVPNLEPDHYEIDEKQRSASFTDAGQEKLEELLATAELLKGSNLYDIENVTNLHHAQNALRAHKLFQRDRDYIVKGDQVVIIDEFTGRMMEGRRYGDGLHQAIEAKEGVQVQPENQTLASITFQNYFRMYPKLAGMTGTALTEAAEFEEIYKLSVVSIPTNRPIARLDEDDEVYLTAGEKHKAMIQMVLDCHAKQQPVLVGTTSIERSEMLSAELKKHKIDHKVLNARFHEEEAKIIAQAGRPGAVTLATNMAGRGTDIQLGGNLDMMLSDELDGVTDDAKIAQVTADITARRDKEKEVALEAGGLAVIGTERHESRRIDNQLRGRTGRQGDPGVSRFFLSLEDDLMRIFGGERMDSMLRKLGVEEGEAITHRWITRALEKAQQKVEARNFDIRKNLLQYDDVMNDQRKVIFEQRREIMESEDISATIREMRENVIEEMVAEHIPAKAYAAQWDAAGLEEKINNLFGLELPISEWAGEEGIADEEILDRIERATAEQAAKKATDMGPEMMRMVEKSLLLQVMDHNWKDHLHQLDHLRQGINLRAFAQKNPLNEYKSEAFQLFQLMLDNVREAVTGLMARVQLQPQAPMPDSHVYDGAEEMHQDPVTGENEMGYGQAMADENRAQPVRNAAATEIDPNDPSTWGKVQRNAACPCGSGKKYKHCHGAVGAQA